MSLLNASTVSEIQARGTITRDDVLAIRRSFFEDGTIEADEAEMLFKLNDTCTSNDMEWADCFVELLTDYLVEQATPEGYVTVENADWLLERIRTNGRVDSRTELELLINVVDKARWAPERLVLAALDEVKSAVVSGDGALRSNKTLVKGQVGEAEVELMKRILYAFGGDSNVAITRREAEILFDINDATAGAENADSWRDLFVKAIANAVLASSGYSTPTREQALARESWLEKRGELSAGSMLGSMVSGGLAGIFSAYRQQSAEERAIQSLERQKVEIVTAERIEPAEATWLMARLDRDGALTPNEAALVEFIKEHASSLAPQFQARFGSKKSAA